MLATLLEDHMNEDTLAQSYYKQGLLLLGDECGIDSEANNTAQSQPDITPKLKII